MNANEGWCVSKNFVARDENDAWEHAMRWAEVYGYCDLIMA